MRLRPSPYVFCVTLLGETVKTYPKTTTLHFLQRAVEIALVRGVEKISCCLALLPTSAGLASDSIVREPPRFLNEFLHKVGLDYDHHLVEIALRFLVGEKFCFVAMWQRWAATVIENRSIRKGQEEFRRH